MTTVSDIAHQVIDPLTGGADDILALAVALTERAKTLGLVLTITTIPGAGPFAMGNTDAVVDVQRRLPHHGPHIVLVPVYSPEVQEVFLRMLQTVERGHRTEEANDAFVGRRRRFSSNGGLR